MHYTEHPAMEIKHIYTRIDGAIARLVHESTQIRAAVWLYYRVLLLPQERSQRGIERWTAANYGRSTEADRAEPFEIN